MSSIYHHLQPSLVPFDTRWQPGCQLIFRDRMLELHDEAVLRRFSWTVDTEGSRCKLAGKIFYAERYGGSGIGVHGGGARCGFDGERYQLKGIGPNPLLGVIGEDDVGQSDGELTISAALYEMIWSRILDTVLPFGANRCLAILAVPVQSTFSRALLLREGYLRPAHFERAAYFRGGSQGGRYEQVADVRRTAQMCRQLPGIFADTFHLRGNTEYCLTEGLNEFARRQAAQIACATSRFLYHSLSSSNFSLDGKWHDFTSLSPLDPRHLPMDFGMDSAWSTLWRQFALVADVLGSWIFHYAKYTHLSQAAVQALTRNVLTEFEQTLHQQYAFNLLCVMGIPRLIAQLIYTETAVQAWTTSLLSILPSLPFWMQTSAAALPLAALSFSRAATAPTQAGFFQQTRVATWLSQRETVRRRAFDVAQEHGIAARDFTQAVDINAAKFLYPRQAVSWTAMIDSLDGILADADLTLAEKIDRLMPWCEALIAHWRFHLTAGDGMQTTCWQGNNTVVIFDMQTGSFRVSVGGRSCWVAAQDLHAFMATSETGGAFRDYCQQAQLCLSPEG
ncbi:hypothetical protein Q0T19_20380 [Escherichia coli O120:H1]|nr:putative microcin H47 biosynthesis protein [Escherichia coli]CAD5794098.1 putative microcin H47 biosynthesis protein [Escherichia coli]